MGVVVMGSQGAMEDAVAASRIAASGWRRLDVGARLAVIGRARRLIGARAVALAASVGDRRPLADTLAAEVLPLAEAARFLERRAARVLAPRRLGWVGRPLWLAGVASEIRRDPLGAVLILAPANYPLFLPGAQLFQALAAGNAVCVKPAPGCAGPMLALAALLSEAGLPDGVLRVLDDTMRTGVAASRAGFDHIVLTGSAETGRAVLTAAAATLTPATVELSGNDAVFVMPGADLALVVACLAYGMRLNHGATCIAPRRVFVPRAMTADFEARLVPALAALPTPSVPPAIAARLEALAAEAVAMGARRLPGPVVVLADAAPSMRLLREDVFAPWLALVAVDDMAEAVAAAALCPYALGASVFGPAAAALALAAVVPAGSVCVNDLIVPTADPRLPFGGHGASGFGVTRGAEGLLAMTRVRAISARRGWLRPHLDPKQSADAGRMAGLVAVLHGGWRAKLAGLRGLVGRG
jgi:acyl-CoA reductase-like NAD-dependent aldehyde dehydrogenase